MSTRTDYPAITIPHLEERLVRLRDARSHGESGLDGEIQTLCQALTALDTLRSDNARLREALIYCKDHIEADRQDRMGSPAAGCYAAAKASAALANGAE